MAPQLPSFTAEQRIAILEKSRTARAANVAHAAKYLCRDFMDAPEWDRLAKLYGVQLPVWSARCSARLMGNWVAKVGLNRNDYGDLGEWARLNPQWPLRSFVGLMLEERARHDPAAENQQLELVEA